MHISILLLAALAIKASASDIVWEPLCEPGCGGAIVSLAVSPHNPRHLVSGGDMLGTAVSFDAGETWTPGMGLPAYEMATPTFHPQRTNELWIGSCMGPFLSRDGGKTWQWRRKGMPKASRYHYTAMIEKVLVDPVDPNRLLAFGGSSRRWGTCEAMGAIWVSENGGDDWRRVGTISSDGFTTNAVKGANIVKAWWSAEKRPWVNIFAESAGWFSSLDGGLTWRRRKVSGLHASLGSVTTHPADPGIVWAVVAPAKNEGDEPRTPGAIWRSSDGGRTFHPCDAGIVKTADGNPNLVSHFSEIEASPVRLGRLYVSDLSWKSHAIWVSDDAGTTWRKGCSKKDLETACFAGPGCRIAASPTEPDVAYAYNSEYMLKTTDGGRTWHDATAVRPMASKLGNWRGRGWNGWCSRNVAFNPYRRGQSVVQAMDAGRGWISDDGLKSWHYAHGGVDPWCGGNGAAFSRDGSIYLTTGQNGHNNGIVFSHDGGCSWSASSGPKHGLPERGEGSYGGVWVDPDDGRRAFALFDGKRYVTEDGGISWAGEKTEKSGAFAADPTTPGRFFVKSADGVFETHDWKSFRLMGLPGASEGKIACDAVGRVLVCRGRTGDSKTRGLWRCDPSGGEWVRLHDDPLACAVAADPKDPTRLVLTTSDNPYHDFAGANGVYVSSDDGKTWQPANEGLHVRRLTCVAFDPFDGETLVAGTLGGGFVKTTWPRSAAMAAIASDVDIDALCPPRPETAAKFKAGAYPPPSRSWREAAMAAYRYMASLPAMTALVETGKPYRLYQHNAYVSKTHASHIKAMLLWAREDPERREEAMRLARASAEFLLGELEPSGVVLAFWPPTYGRKPLEFDPATDGPYNRPSMVGNEPEGAVKYRGEVMLVYPANVGLAFLAYHAATKDARFLAAAVGIGETYMRTRRHDGSWPLKMKLATGEPIGVNVLVPTRPLLLFEALFKETGDAKWREAADNAFAWLDEHPLKDWNWDGQFEDIKPAAPYKNPTKHNAMDAMMYILDRFPRDSARLAQCRRLLEFCEKRFVVWGAPPNHAQWPAPSVLEQYSCFTPIDSSAAKMIRAYLALYRATGDGDLLEKARALGGTVTRVQKPSGRIPTFWEGVNNGDSGLSDERYDWLNCMEASAAALLELSKARGLRRRDTGGERALLDEPPAPSFAIELFDGRTGTVCVSSRELGEPKVTRADGRTRLVWKGHPRLGADFTATADGVAAGDATEWTFSCSGNASGLPIGRIAFPIVDVPCADDGYLLYSPDAGGGTMGWKKRILWKGIPGGKTVCSTMSPGFRFVAVLNGESRDSYYLDVRDPASNAGRFEVKKAAAGTARLAWIHDVPMTPENATACRLPCSATVRAYRGDWFEAAAFYRDWAKTTPRYAAARARDMSRLRDIGLWMWNRGLAETVIPPVERFMADTGLKVALDWYWWFKEMPGTFYPDYWPPREGAAKFKADVQRLKAMGAFTQVYLNGMTWDEDVPSWKDGGPESVAMRRDGTYFSYAYNRFNPNHRLANLCGEAPKFHSRIMGQIAHLVDCGFDSIYLDMIGCNAYGPCFNPAHRHAPGGGTHMTDGFRAYLGRVKKANPGLLLSTEDCGEAYVDVFDSNISTHSSYERHGWIGTAPNVEFVAVFQAVYHGCAAVFGNYAIVDNVPYWDPRWPMKPWWTGHEERLRSGYPDQFAVEFSRGPVWGLQPSVHNFWLHHATNEAFAAEYRFIRETAKFYHDHREFLFDGEMLHPGRLGCRRLKVEFAKVSVFDEKVASHASTLPAVFHNVWRAPDGRVAAFLVNWTRKPQAWKLEAPAVSGEGVIPPRSWTLVHESPVRRR